jgi:peptidoglycan pentaglycine glycine transferase (the first glycine)
MLTIRVLDLEDRFSWDHLTQHSFMQAWAWGEFKQREGFRVMRVGLFDVDRLVGGMTLCHYPQFQGPNLLTAIGGPCFLPGYEIQGLPPLIDFAQTLAQEWEAIALRIQPSHTLSLEGLTRAPGDTLPIETLLIDLTPPEAEILAAMKSKGRYNIKLSQKHNVENTFTRDSQAIPKFYDLFTETAKRQEFFAEPYRYIINLCQTLFLNNMAEIGFAYYQGELLATVLLIHWGDRTTYLYGGRSLQHPNVMSTYGLHWSALQRAKSRGSKTYDFYGYSPKLNHSYSQFSRFKEKFGGQYTIQPTAQDFIFYDRLAASLADVFTTMEEHDNLGKK